MILVDLSTGYKCIPGMLSGSIFESTFNTPFRAYENHQIFGFRKRLLQQRAWPLELNEPQLRFVH